MSGEIECLLAVAVVDLLHHLPNQVLVLFLSLLHRSDRAFELVDSLLHVLMFLLHRVLELLGLRSALPDCIVVSSSLQFIVGIGLFRGRLQGVLSGLGGWSK